MNKRNKIIKISAITFGILLVLTIIHVILVVDTRPVDNGNIQLTRVDFKKKLEPSVATPMQTAISKLPGVTQTVLNTQEGNIVVGFDNNKTSIGTIYDKLEQSYPDLTTMYIPSEGDLAGTCPVMNRNSTAFKMISSIKNIF